MSPMTNSKGPRLSAYRIAKLVISARTDSKSLLDLCCYCEDHEVFNSMSAELRADCLDVFCHHLSEPVNGRQYKEDPDLRNSLFGVFTGIAKMAFCIRESAVLQAKFVKAWPDIMKWSKLIFKAGLLCDIWTMSFFNFTAVLHAIAEVVHGEGLKDPTAFEIAVYIWIGRTTLTGIWVEGTDSPANDIFYVNPLLFHLEQEHLRADRVSRLLSYYKNDAVELVDSVLSRINACAQVQGTLKVKAVEGLTLMLFRLCAAGTELVRRALVTSYTAVICTHAATAVVNIDNPARDGAPALYNLIDLIHLFVQCVGHKCSTAIVKAGIFAPLLKVASLENTTFFKTHSFSTVAILECFIHHLTFEGMVKACRVAFETLYANPGTVQNLLRLSSAAFQQAWASFSSHLHKQAVLSRIFAGYSSELGVCANTSCSVMTLRKEFRKCAGCAIALYCTENCQKADWNSHRRRCEEMDNDALQRIRDKTYRFPRRVASAHVRECWETLTRLALELPETGISKKNLAIIVTFSRMPTTVEARDVHDFLADGHPPYLPLVASEYLRLGDKSSSFAMVILRIEDMPKVAYLAYLDVLHYNNPEMPPESPVNSALYGIFCKREEGKIESTGIRFNRSDHLDNGKLAGHFKDGVIEKEADLVIKALGRGGEDLRRRLSQGL